MRVVKPAIKFLGSTARSTVNWIGDRLDYDRCPVTGDSFLIGEWGYVEEVGRGFLYRAFKQYTLEEIADKLIKKAGKGDLEKVVEELTDKARYLGLA